MIRSEKLKIYFEKIKNKLLLIGANYFAKLLALVSSIILARALSVDDYADLVFLRSIGILIMPMVTIGMPQVVLYFGLKKGANIFTLERYALVRVLFYGIPLTVASYLVVSLFKNKCDLYVLTSLVALESFILALYTLVKMYLRVQGKYKTLSISILYFSTISLLSSLLGMKFSVIYIPIFMVMGLLIFILKHIPFSRINLGLKQSRDFIQYGKSVAVGGLFNKFLLTVDILFLGFLDYSNEVISSYKMSALLPGMLILLIQSILLVDFERFVNENLDELKSYYYSYLKKTTIIVSIMIVVFVYCGDLIMSIIFGLGPDNGGYMWKHMVLVGTIVLFRMPLGQILNARGLAKENVKLVIIHSCILVILLALIPDVSPGLVIYLLIGSSLGAALYQYKLIFT